MSEDFVDLSEIVQIWANESHKQETQYREADDTDAVDIDWSHMTVEHGPTVYYDEVMQKDENFYVLFASCFTNITEQTQIFNFKGDRQTRSYCRIAMDKTYVPVLGGNFNIKVSPPNPVVEANTGFKGLKSVSNIGIQTFQDDMVWYVDSAVSVPPNRKIKAELLVRNVDYHSKFKCETRFSGQIHIKLRNRFTQAVTSTVTAEVQDIFGSMFGFRSDRKDICFISEGQCKSRFGVEQQIRLSTGENKSVLVAAENDQIGQNDGGAGDYCHI